MDWEAILARHPQQFLDRLGEWFFPPAALPLPPLPGCGGHDWASAPSAALAPPAIRGVAAAVVATDRPGASDTNTVGSTTTPIALPTVNEVLVTLRQRLEALNWPEEVTG